MPSRRDEVVTATRQFPYAPGRGGALSDDQQVRTGSAPGVRSVPKRHRQRPTVI